MIDLRPMFIYFYQNYTVKMKSLFLPEEFTTETSSLCGELPELSTQLGTPFCFLTAEVLVGKLAGGLKRKFLPPQVYATGL